MVAIRPGDDYLAWFLGPKAENSVALEEAILLALRDYIHWRRNYFPGDKILITEALRKALASEQDVLTQHTIDMMAQLRRNFPFYSPRYIAHQLSDTTLAAMIGYFAGMLFNANNVTPEAAPVTVELEIQACSRLLAMLGYDPPPVPPITLNEWPIYKERLEAEFSWAHLTHGGTTANIEALWFARMVRYAPLAIQEIADKYDLSVEIPRNIAGLGEKTTANKPEARERVATNIRRLSRQQLFCLSPNDAIFLLATYVKAARTALHKSGKEAMELLDESCFSSANGLGQTLNDHPPAVFVSGAAHYSIKKAAQVLGLGRKSISIIRTDPSFRLDIADLERQLRAAVKEGRAPITVVAIAGTTEEGAVDPIDKILDLRDKLEAEGVTSFWLHIDAAWGGYMRTLFRWSDSVLGGLAEHFGIETNSDLSSFHQQLTAAIRRSLAEQRTDSRLLASQLDALLLRLASMAQQDRVDEYVAGLAFLEDPPWQELAPRRRLGESGERVRRDRHLRLDGPWVAAHPRLQELSDVLSVPADVTPSDWHKQFGHRLLRRCRSRFADKAALLEASLDRRETAFKQCLEDRDQDAYARQLRSLLGQSEWLRALGMATSPFQVTAKSRMQTVQSYVRAPLSIGRKHVTLQWPCSDEVCNAFVAFPKADSITVDPHKMGYAPYPCGLIAFRNDRVRHFAMEEAPYITSAKNRFDAHQPPRHLATIPDEERETESLLGAPGKIEIDAFAPFILEGSRPGAAATSLWLASTTIPLTMFGHGSVIRASLLAARALYEWLLRWNQITREEGRGASYEFLPTTTHPPDTNIVTFVIRRIGSRSLADMNRLTKAVYDSFSIQAELGEREYSYSQPYFLSHTPFETPGYQFETVKSLLERCDIANARAVYAKEGIMVLRASVMTPYITAMQEHGVADVIKDFMRQLSLAADAQTRASIR